MKTDSVKVGDKIQFVYSGGSHPNSIRTVTVSETTPKAINGFDEYVNEYRSFLKDKISFLQSVRPIEQLAVTIEKYGNEYYIDIKSNNKQVSFRVEEQSEKIYDEDDNQLNSFDDLINELS